MLFYIKYGCSISHEQLVVDAENQSKAEEYAKQSAQDVYYSYDCNYPSDEDYEDYDEDELSDLEYQDMLNDIDWVVEEYDEKNESHKDALHEQDDIPFAV